MNSDVYLDIYSYGNLPFVLGNATGCFGVIKPLVGEDTIIVPFLNGVEAADQLRLENPLFLYNDLGRLYFLHVQFLNAKVSSGNQNHYCFSALFDLYIHTLLASIQRNMD